MNLQSLLAALGLVVCLALLAHHALGARRQARLSWRWQGFVARLRLRWSALRESQRRRQATRSAGHAAREAADVIERARRGAGASGADDTHRGPPGNGAARDAGAGRAEGSNVVRPPRFGDRPNDLH